MTGDPAISTESAQETPDGGFSSSRLADIFLMIDSLETGGSERQFATIARALDQNRFHVQLGCIRSRGSFLDNFSDVAIPQFRLGGSAYGFRSWRTRLRLARYLKHRQIAVAHAFDFYTNLALIPAARLAGVPVVIGSQRQLGDLLSPLGFRAQLAMLGWCDAVVCNSHAASERLIEHGVRESRIVVIGNALAPSAFAEAEPALPRRSNTLRVGMIARMNSSAKNHAAFLRVAARLKNKFPSAEFVLVGDGPLRKQLESEAERLNMAGQVRFLGDRRDIRAVLASLDVTVLPSTSESLSNAILESMAAGVPVAAYRVGGNPELLSGDRGVLVSSGDELSLADAVERLLGDEQSRQRFGANGRQFAQQHFALDQIRRQYEELYAGLLEKKAWQPKPGSVPTRVKVGIVAASLRYVGGQSAQADLLLREWQNDPEVDAGFVPIDPEFPQAIRWLERIPGLRTFIREPKYMRSLWRELKTADIVHIFSASYWSFLIAPAPAWIIARMRGQKVLLHYHSGEAPDHLRRSRLARYVLKRVDRIVVPSEYLVKVFGEFELKAEMVPNVADVTRFRFRHRNPLRPHLICTRGFHPYYCLDDVVRAFVELKRSFPEASLDLAGSGPEEQCIRALVAQLSVTGVNFTGAVSRTQMPQLYDRADIFINASRLDNMPVSILEAFASGTPVVSTAPEGIRYVVEHERTGLLSGVGDWKGLAENVVRLLNDQALGARLAANAREEVQGYSWDKIRAQWLRIYRSVAAS